MANFTPMCSVRSQDRAFNYPKYFQEPDVAFMMCSIRVPAVWNIQARIKSTIRLRKPILGLGHQTKASH